MSEKNPTPFNPPLLADVLLWNVRQRCDLPPDEYARHADLNAQADQQKMRLLHLLEKLEIRTWPDVVTYLAKHDRNVDHWLAMQDDGTTLVRLIELLEVANADDVRNRTKVDP
jgi:hypothetical protein